jgi:hypothetical protein
MRYLESVPLVSRHWAAIAVGLLFGSVTHATDLPTATEVESEPFSEPIEEMTLEEISVELDNPLTSLWSLTFEDSFSILKGDLIEGSTTSNVLFFQPGLPVPMGKDLTFIARPAFPLVTSPVLDPEAEDGVSGHTSGLGDIQMLAMVGPDRSSGFVWGAGGTFKFPTAANIYLGSGKWQAGPALMLFNFKRPWTIGFLLEHWWSYAGDDDRADTSRTELKYIVRYALPDAWSIGLGPTVSIDWEAESADRYTVPIGLGVTKTIRFGQTPVKFRLEGHYSVIRPEDLGTEWKIMFRIAPVIPSPFSR